MSKRLTITLLIINFVLSTMAGAYAGFYAAVSMPLPTPIAVIDIDGISEKLIASGAGPERIQRSLELAKKQTAYLAKQGIVVIDKGVVLAAPAEAYINVDPN